MIEITRRKEPTWHKVAGGDISLQVGDRVRMTKHNTGYGEGTVRRLPRIDNTSCAVEFDKNILGHSCDGLARGGYGWFCLPHALEVLRDD